MTHSNDQTPRMTRPVTGTIVSRPHHTDAIGKALSCAFGSARTLPPDMMLALSKLDLVG